MIGFELLVKIRKEKRIEFLQLFDMLKADNQQVDGRLEVELFEQVSHPNTFLWREHWGSDELLTLYRNENKYRAMMGAINILGELVYKKRFTITGGDS